MQNVQYTIGEFAAINKISTRMLRHYDKIGLFQPAAILPNGYRAYCSEQVAVLSKIKRYQGCGFTLSEIGSLLRSEGAQVGSLAREKQKELQARGVQNNNAYMQLCCLLGEQPPAFENSYAVSFTMQEKRLYLLHENWVPENQIEAEFDRLYLALEEIGGVATGPPVLFSHGMEALYRAGAPVAKELRQSGYFCETLPQGWYLSTLHFGDYSGIGAAYDRLFQAAKELGKCASPPYMERYFLDCAHTPNPVENITEISIKIAP